MVNLEGIARVCYAANIAISEAAGASHQATWEETDQDAHKDAMKAVEYVLGNASATAEDQHNAWLDQKKAEGWRWSDKSDDAYKTHPRLMPYDELPFDEKVKYHVFRAIVAAMS